MDWTPPSKTTATVTTTSTPTTAPVPTDIAEGTNIKCAEYYDVQKGDYCNNLVLKFGISLDDFLFLNSGVNQNCTNLYADESYCVAPVGPINEYPGHPGYIPPTSSVPDVPYSNLPKATYTPPPITGLPQHLPLAHGTRSDCFAYANGADLDVDITYTYYKSVCDALAHGWGVTLEQLQNWNPSLDTSSEDCAPEEGYRYCMKGYASTVTGGPPPPTQTPSSVSSGSTPSSTQLPIRDGTITDCNKYEAVVSPMTCASVLKENGITIAQFYQWNPEVGEQCTNLWLGYRYCISGPTASSTSTTTSPTNGPQPPGPTQAGEPDNCNKWHLVESGDNCYSVAQEAGITLDQFYK
ncbi:LysM domain-containing protein, partial [Aspergillus sp. HF37]